MFYTLQLCVVWEKCETLLAISMEKVFLKSHYHLLPWLVEVYALSVKPWLHRQIQTNPFGTIEKIETYEKGVGVSN